jgi:UDP-galactopyranose mutase
MIPNLNPSAAAQDPMSSPTYRQSSSALVGAAVVPLPSLRPVDKRNPDKALHHPEDSGASPRRWDESSGDLVCFSHLRWDFVFQRPQHLLTRFARTGRVFHIEEPFFDEQESARMECSRREGGLHILTPHLRAGLSEREQHDLLRLLVDRTLAEHGVADYLLWFYTPMALPYANHLTPRLVVYDCMDELSAFAGAPPVMAEREAQLMSWADVVFTGGHSLYEAKRHRHPNIHPFPSSIDHRHFAKACLAQGEPPDQRPIPHPRIGFFGVVDERFDIGLLDGLARKRPDWHFVIIGPVVKIDPAILPRHPNIHYLGRKDYQELPQYLNGWDVAMLPFARNESTRYISPTKTPEYLCAGRAVVSTAITDVVRPYGENRLVHIADDADGFVAAISRILEHGEAPDWKKRVSRFLAKNSWDHTWRAMCAVMAEAQREKGFTPAWDGTLMAQKA